MSGIKKYTQAVVNKLRNRFRRNIHLLLQVSRNLVMPLRGTNHELRLCEASAPPMTGPIPFAKATTDPYAT